MGMRQHDEGVVPIRKACKGLEGKSHGCDMGVSFASDVNDDEVDMKGPDGGIEDADGDGVYPVEVFLGLFYHGGRLGVAVYDEGEATLSICQMKDGYAEMEVRVPVHLEKALLSLLPHCGVNRSLIAPLL